MQIILCFISDLSTEAEYMFDFPEARVYSSNGSTRSRVVGRAIVPWESQVAIEVEMAVSSNAFHPDYSSLLEQWNVPGTISVKWVPAF